MTDFPIVNDKDLDTWRWLSRTRDAVFKARMKELHKHRISARQASMMFVIQSLGKRAIPAEISRWLFRESHSVSEFLIRMEKERLIRKVKDLERRNLVRVEFTEKGRKAFELATRLDSIHKIMSVLSDEERRQLEQCLSKVWYRSLEVLGIEARPPFPPPNKKMW